jgi:hypothetical protein
MKAMMILSLALALGACNVKKEDKNLSYELSENGCETKRHEFSSQQEYCDGLKNDALNNYCASNLRYNEFKQNCAGQSWQ